MLTRKFFLFLNLLVFQFFSISVFRSILFPSQALASNYAPHEDPEYDLDIRSYDYIGQGSGLVPFVHELYSAPKLCGLVENVARPAVTTLNRIHQYDFVNNIRLPELEPKPADAPGDYANVVGFSTSLSPTKNILVPDSSFDIGGGREVAVYYISAAKDEIFFMYNSGGDIRNGYGIHIKGLRVRDDLYDWYVQLNNAGRNELPALYATDILGTASGDILVAIRDSGSWMDPRWQQDWWDPCNTPAKASNNPLGKIGLTPEPPKWVSTQCNPNDHGDRTSRPIPLEACNTTGKLATSCSTSFKITDQVEYTSCDEDPAPQCTDICTQSERDDGKCHPLTTDWTGTLTIDARRIQLPFAGKRTDSAIFGLFTREWESEQKYLADYFDGTNEYYRNYNEYWHQYVDYGGVLRKLTPMTFQDQLKTSMTQRALASKANNIIEGKIHDYNVTYPTRICWDIPIQIQLVRRFFNYFNLKSQIFSFFRKNGLDIPEEKHLYNHCLFNYNLELFAEIKALEKAFKIWNNSWLGKMAPIKYYFADMGITNQTQTQPLSEIANHLPPPLDDHDYENKWNAWKNTTWGHLWEAVPLVSREDTKGQIVPYLGAYPKDTLVLDPNTEANQQAQIEKVPHLARLYESSKLVWQILTPYTKNGSQTADAEINSNPKTLLASTKIEDFYNTQQTTYNKDGNLVKEVYAAEAEEGFHLEATASLTPPNQVYMKVYFIKDPGSDGPGCDGDVTLEMPPGHHVGGPNGWNNTGAPFEFGGNPAHTGSPITVNDGQTVTVSYLGRIGGLAPRKCAGKTATLTCNLTNNGGTLETNCGLGQTTPPSCKWTAPFPIDKCIKDESITDSNPNDGLFGANDKPMTFKVTAWEQFNNTNYSPCSQLVCRGWNKPEGHPQRTNDDINITDCNICYERGRNLWPDSYEIYGPFTCETLPGRSQGTKYTKDVEREVGVSLYHPYLSEIYKYTAGPTGVFNIFRPESHPEFPDTPARSKFDITYSYQPDSGPGGAQPGTGKFYFPYLGGIQQAKQWVTQTLIPLNTNTVAPKPAPKDCEADLGGECTDNCAETLGTGLPGGDGCSSPWVCCKK